MGATVLLRSTLLSQKLRAMIMMVILAFLLNISQGTMGASIAIHSNDTTATIGYLNEDLELLMDSEIARRLAINSKPSQLNRNKLRFFCGSGKKYGVPRCEDSRQNPGAKPETGDTYKRNIPRGPQ